MPKRRRKFTQQEFNERLSDLIETINNKTQGEEAEDLEEEDLEEEEEEKKGAKITKEVEFTKEEKERLKYIIDRMNKKKKYSYEPEMVGVVTDEQRRQRELENAERNGLIVNIEGGTKRRTKRRTKGRTKGRTKRRTKRRNSR